LQLLSSQKRATRKEACWTISNISAGNKSQIQAIIDANIIPHLIALLGTSDFDIKKEVAWALSNATSGGSSEQIRYLVDCKILEPMCELLSLADTRIILVALEGIENILKAGEKEARATGINEYATFIEECRGIDKLEVLQNHPHTEIYEKAVSLLEIYFAAEEEDQNVAVTATRESYSFGVNAQGAFNF